MRTSKNMSGENPMKLGFRHCESSAMQISWPSPFLSILNMTRGQPYASMSESSVMTCNKSISCCQVLHAKRCTASTYTVKVDAHLRPAKLMGIRIKCLFAHRMYHAIDSQEGHLRICLIGGHDVIHVGCLQRLQAKSHHVFDSYCATNKPSATTRVGHSGEVSVTSINCLAVAGLISMAFW